MRIAVLADIHGNLPALEAVAADLEKQAPDVVVLAGDQVNRCPWSNDVLDLIQDKGWAGVAGNHDWIVRVLATTACPPMFDDRVRFADFWHTWSTLRPEHFAALDALPFERVLVYDDGPPIRLLHGGKDNPFEGFTAELSERRTAELLGGIAEPVVVSAHTHVPLDRRLGPQHLLNPGSVGMPYNGDPRAQYLLLDGDGSRWQPTFCQVDYDRERIRRAFVDDQIAATYGPLGPLYLKTLLTGQPWASDFLVWLRGQAETPGGDLAASVDAYLSRHGPGQWAFSPPH